MYFLLTYVLLRVIIIIVKGGSYLKVSELIKLLKKNGCYLIRHGKKHDIWFSPITKKQFPVPRHPSQDIKSGTLSSIKDAAGI